MSEHKKSKYYLPTILLGVIVAAIFLLAIFTYQVEESEQALVLTVGKPTAVTGPGLHFRLPLPIQEVIKYDIRKRQSGRNDDQRQASGGHRHQCFLPDQRCDAVQTGGKKCERNGRFSVF